MPENFQRKFNNTIRYWLSGYFSKKKVDKKSLIIVGVHYGVVCRWIRAWKARGTKGLEIKKRGREVGQRRVLTAPQEKELKKLLCNKNPKQLKLPFALWNRKAIQSAIYQLWRVRIAIRTIGDYMEEMGLYTAKTNKESLRAKPQAVQEWLDHTYPEIKKLAEKEKRLKFIGCDETGVRNDCQHSRGYAPRGQNAGC